MLKHHNIKKKRKLKKKKSTSMHAVGRGGKKGEEERTSY